MDIEQPLPRARPGEAAIDWPALEFVDVFKLYHSGSVETVALRGLDLRVERGEFVAVLGRSGSGKSTFLHLAAGLDDASAGDVRAFGRPLTRMTERELAGYRGRAVAWSSRRDNLWGEPDRARERRRIAEAGAGRGRRTAGGLRRSPPSASAGRRHVRSSVLSGGRAAARGDRGSRRARSSLVLADEPTGELDAGNERIVLDALARLRDVSGATS